MSKLNREDRSCWGVYEGSEQHDRMRTKSGQYMERVEGRGDVGVVVAE